jgi:hypothetical protein
MTSWAKLLLAGLGLAALGATALADDKPADKKDTRVFELRTYYAAPGKMSALHARFRDHTCKLFEKHGMTIVGFWSPSKPEEAEQKLIYILAYPSKEAAEKAWKNFVNDPDWKKAKAESEKDGTLVTKLESVYMNPTDYSPMK